MANDNSKKQQTINQINEYARAKATRQEIKFYEKNGNNLTFDVYDGKQPFVLLKNKPEIRTPDNIFVLKQDAVLHGYHKRDHGNLYVHKEAKGNLDFGEEKHLVKQLVWDKQKKESTHYVEVFNTVALEKFTPPKGEAYEEYTKPLDKDKQDALVSALEKNAFGKLDNGATKDGLAYYEVANDFAHVPKTDNREQYIKDLCYVAASREVAKRHMEKHSPHHISFRRMVKPEEQLILKHALASELRIRFGVGGDADRNGFHRNAPIKRKNAINYLKNNERALFDIARRANGIANEMERAYFKGILRDPTDIGVCKVSLKPKAKVQDNDKDNSQSL